MLGLTENEHQRFPVDLDTLIILLFSLLSEFKCSAFISIRLHVQALDVNKLLTSPNWHLQKCIDVTSNTFAVSKAVCRIETDERESQRLFPLNSNLFMNNSLPIESALSISVVSKSLKSVCVSF